MGIYFDLHSPAEVPMSVVRRGVADARQGIEDRHHVRQVDFYCCPEGAIYCVLEAPGPEAVCARHAERGFACDEVSKIDGIQGDVPLSQADRQLVDQALARDWQARHPPA